MTSVYNDRSVSKVEVTGSEARHYDFISRDLQAILREQGFNEFHTHPHYLGYVRLLAARKTGGN